LDRFLPASGSRELVTVVDSYEANRALLEAIATRSRRCCFFDDYARLDYPDGVLVNAAVIADSLYPTHRDGLRYLTGPRYTVLQKAFWESPPFKVHRTVQRVLVTLGSAVAAAKAQEVSSTIRRALPEAVITLLHPVAATATVRARDGIRWAWETKTERVRDLARSSDLAVCAGGQTLLELGSLGVPAICLLTAANQKANAVGLQKAGFSTLAGSLDDPACLDELGVLLRKLLPFEVRAHRSGIGRKLVDGKGALRVVADLFGEEGDTKT
jgi:spore coat polysaccharide biosynthesis predicted glycosyltransferase SpsG